MDPAHFQIQKFLFSSTVDLEAMMKAGNVYLSFNNIFTLHVFTLFCFFYNPPKRLFLTESF